MNAICCNIMYDNIEIFKKIYDAYARYEKNAHVEYRTYHKSGRFREYLI